MAENLKRVVIVTGGGGNIGQAIGKKFSGHGDQVITAQRHSPSDETVEFIKSDLSNATDCNNLITQTIKRYGRLDVLINNAAIMEQQSVEDTSLEMWDQTMAVNLRAPFLLTKYALAHLRKNKGSIINIASIEASASNPQHSAYGASKAGLEALTRATAVDHGHEVRCNAISPGWIDTQLNHEFVEAMPRPECFKKNLANIHPSGRIGQPEDVANLAYFLASDQASFICGQTFTIDGGRTIQLPLPHSK